MNKGDSQSLLFSWPALSFMAVLASGVYLSQTHLESSRPPAPLSVAESEETVVDARLWQDPLLAVERHFEQHGHLTEPNSESDDGEKAKAVGLDRLRDRLSLELRQLSNANLDVDDCATEHNAVHVMMVMIRGGNSADDNERRLRSRQAVLAAFRASGYTPENTEQIEYFKLAWQSTWGLRRELEPHRQENLGAIGELLKSIEQKVEIEKSNKPLLVPYEWFRAEALLQNTPSKASSKPVVVMYLNNSKFDYRPLFRIAHFVKEISKPVDSESQVPSQANDGNNKDANNEEPKSDDKKPEPAPLPELNLTFSLIGPTRSTVLRTMLEEASSGTFDDLSERKVFGSVSSIVEQLDKIQMFSPWVTAESEILLHGGSVHKISNSLEENLRNTGLKGFYRTTCTDAQLAEQLIQELKRRGVDVNPKNRQAAEVALITEWDTFYGRAFPLTFAAAMLGEVENGEIGGLMSDAIASSPHNLKTFTYVRGIDGNVPNDPATQNRSGLGEDKPATDHPESPTGRSQLDYIRRMSNQLAEKYTGPGKPPLRAIGIVGSDVYDKLLMLQALRHQFPNALFFTTDLDSRLFHFSQFPWTRNLIVASNFGLALKDEYQHGVYNGGIASFRENYQTAIFLSCRLALGLPGVSVEKTKDGEPGKVVETALLQKKLRLFTKQPRLFEIGRDRAVDISVEPDRKQAQYDIHPPIRGKFELETFIWQLVIGTSVVVVGFIMMFQISTTMKRQIARGLFTGDAEQRATDFVWLGIIVVAFLFIVIVFYDHTMHQSGEPMSLVAGISVWPSVALRWAAIGLSLLFLIRGLFDLRRNLEGLTSKLKIFEDGERPPDDEQRNQSEDEEASWLSKLRSYYYGISIGHLRGELTEERPGVEPSIAIDRLWVDYLHRSNWRSRFLRTTSVSVTYALLIFLLMTAFEFPSFPYRGFWSWAFGGITLWLGFPLMAFLTFAVVDATLLCYRFTRKLSQRPSAWPKSTIKEVKKLRGMAARDKEDGLADWIDIHVIANRTEAVGKLVYYPFIVLLIMYTARLSYLDNFHWPPLLVTYFLVLGGYTLGCAIALRSAAERARESALERLRKMVANLTDAKRKEPLVSQIQLLISEIESTRNGAFAPFNESPYIRAALIPSGGVAILTFFERWISGG